MQKHLSADFGMLGRSAPRTWLALALAALLAMTAVVVSSTGGNVSGVLAANDPAKFSVTVLGPVTAGTQTTVTVTALTQRNAVIKSYDGSTTVALGGLLNSPGCAGCETPILPSGPTYGSGLWNDGVGTYSGVIAVRAQSNAQVTATDSAAGATGSVTFAVGSAAASQLVFSNSSQNFNGQPIATKFDQPINSVCGPYVPANPGAANPCAAATSTPTKVLAVDGFGNRKAGIAVTITSNPSGVSGGGSTQTAGGADPTVAGYGEASFSNLRITDTGQYVLRASAATVPTATSQSFAIVSDLAACDNQSCTNNGNNGGDSSTLQRAYGRIQTGGDFYVLGGNNVLLNTQFVDPSGADGTDLKCGSNDTIGEATDIAVLGSGSSITTKITMVLVTPKDTLKADGILNRGTPSFNVCLGASVLSQSLPTAWTQKDGSPAVQSPVDVTPTRFWGTPPDCTPAYLASGNPCMALRTKQAATAQAYLGLSNSAFNQLQIKDADLVLILELGYPWDAKGGAY